MFWDIIGIYWIGLVIVACAMIIHPARHMQSWPGIVVSLILWPVTAVMMMLGCIDRIRRF